MVNCRKTIAFVLLLPLVLLLTATALLAGSKEETAQEWKDLRSVSPQKAADPAVAKKAEEQARLAAELAANQKLPAPQWPVDAKVSAERGARPTYDPRVSVLLSEGFESGSVPPAGWSTVVTNPGATFNWYPGTYTFEGLYSAEVLYDPALVAQDEWLISPVLDLTGVTSDIRVEFYWDMSYFWGVDPNDNYDLELRISTDGGATFPTLLWDESGEGVFGDYVYYKEVVSLAAYMGSSSVVLAWRYVGVDGAQANVDFINVTDDAPPVLGPGDNCTDPEKIDLPGDMPYANSNMTCGRGNDYSGTCLAPYDGGEDIVYEITVASPVTVDITLDPLGTSWTGFAVDDMCPPDGSCLAVRDNGGSSTPYSVFGLALAPGTYYLIVDTWPPPDCIPAFDLTITETVAGAPGDNCGNPLPITIPSLPYSDLGQTTCGRLNHYDATCMSPYDGGEDIIYEVTVTSPVTVDITLDPLGTDWTGIVIDAVCPPGSAGCIGFSTNSGTTPHTIFAVSLAPGTYYIMVDTWPAPDCIPTFDLHITEAGGPPANDNWEDAEKVDDLLDYPFCTAGGTLDGPSDDGCNDCANVWYCYTASCDGIVTVDLCGSGYDSKLAAYDGCGEPTSANQLACNDDSDCGLQSTIEFVAIAGNEYLIEVGGYLGSSCNVGCGDISISCSLPCQVECPSGATDEGEPCGEDNNGGCNSEPPAFRTITCGETVCGTGWFDGGLRDTDWYLLTLDGYYEVTWTVQAEFEALIGPVATGTPGSGACEDVLGFIEPAAFPLECEVGSVTFVAGPGSYMLFVAPLFSSLVFCPADYWATVSCVPVAAEYCAAGSNVCDEYISNVAVGDINNSSDCGNYEDYTSLSTAMTIGNAYPISVTNGFPYIEDQCGIWVDWNQDADFFDADEMIAVSGNPGNGPYTASITPPAGALEGPTRMRIRITWIGAVSPCGNTTYGEVEDYTVVVEAASSSLEMALDPDPIYAAMARPIEPRCVDIYIAGDLTPGHGPSDVDGSSLLINGVPAVQSEVLPSHPDFEGEVLHICGDMATFVGGYGVLYNTTTQSYTVTGTFTDMSSFSVGDEFTYIGHIAGDVNVDGNVNILDLSFLVDRIFRGGQVYPDPVEADVNADGAPGNILDLTYMVEFIFRGGPAPLKLE